MAHKFLLSLPWPPGKTPKFVVKVDDDSYVNIAQLWRLLMESRSFDTNHLLMGYRQEDQTGSWQTSQKSRSRDR